MFGIKRKPNAWERFVQSGCSTLEKQNEYMLRTYRAYQNRTSDEIEAAMRESFKKVGQSEDARKCQEIIADLDSKGIAYRIEYLYNGNGETKRFVVPLGMKRDIKPINENKNRCKYCGCLVSSFDTHCKSCGAPI